MHRFAFVPLLGLALTGCGVSLWPFGGDRGTELDRRPANAVAYKCNDGKGFYLRTLENGAAVWLILPERELRLDRTGSAAATNYAYRQTTLEIRGAEAALLEGSKPLAEGCKAG